MIIPYKYLPYKSQKAPKNSVTLIIGIICKDSIVLAADSQTTRGGMKRNNAQKITTVNFGPHKIMVADSGNMGNSHRAIELLSAMSKDQPIEDYRTPADCARRAMMQLKIELREQFGKGSEIEFQDWFRQYEMQSELLIAYYFQNKPYLLKVDLDVGRADKEQSWYAARGCGAELGDYLLTEHTKPGMTGAMATIAAAYIIETVCKHVEYCNPPAKVGVLINDLVEWSKSESVITTSVHQSSKGKGAIIIYATNELGEWAKKVEKIMADEKRNRESKLIRVLNKGKMKNHIFVKSFMEKPTPKGLDKLKKLLTGLQKMESFDSQ